MQWLNKTKSWNLIILKTNESNFVNILPDCSMFWAVHEGFKPWVLVDWWNISGTKMEGQVVALWIREIQKLHDQTPSISWINITKTNIK